MVIEAKKLTKRYRDFWGREKVLALDALDLSVRRGEIFGLLGPNGAGKTTTTKLLLGLIFPTAGEIRVLGRPPRDVEAKARIGYLPEESYLYRFLNADETLDFYGALYGIPRRERKRRADLLIEQVGLARARKRRIKEYSKGMARRIGLAQALIADPDLVILDEPTSGLDPIGTREVKDVILALKERGKTVLLCSHLLSEVERICDRIAILRSGRVAVSGEVKDLLAVKEELRITVRATDGPARERALSALAREGCEVLSTDHPRVTLEDLFLAAMRRENKE
ncbi:MAG: ABC transporter ATP-binding protein [Planctomycetes bacterium]|nr:ABC transporter ATP-binding protein [Planctomycetota bacterium]